MPRSRLFALFCLLCLSLLAGLLPCSSAQADGSPTGSPPALAPARPLEFAGASGREMPSTPLEASLPPTPYSLLLTSYPVAGDWWGQVQQNLAGREYQASLTAQGLQAPNRAHNWRVYFEPTGVRVVERAAGAAELLRLGLAGWGRAGRLEPAQAGQVVNQGGRVEICRAGLVEWYINSAQGLEQGFDLAGRPEGEGEVWLELAVEGARLSQDGERITLRSPGGRTLSYDGLRVYDAAGQAVPARWEAWPGGEHGATGVIRLIIADAAAVYPLTIDPLLTAAADTFLESNQASAELGFSVAGAGDVNGDGYADVIAGAWLYDNGQIDEGAAFVYHGGPGGLAATPAWTVESNQANAELGTRVAGAGDVNGDGYADVIAGVPDYDNGQIDEGAAFVYHGGPGGLAATPAVTLERDQASAYLGYSVAGAGDVNGDGYADVIVGARHYDNGQEDEGAAFVYHGGPGGLDSTPAVTLERNQASAWLGNSVAGAGDVNGDGYADVIVGAPGYDNGQAYEGAAFVYHGGATGLAATPAVTLESNQAEALLGLSVAGAGDVNGDGYADVIVGAPYYDNGQEDEGAAFVYHGGATGLAATPAWTVEGNQTEAHLGTSVAGAGDVNGDGYTDVIAGVPDYDNGQSYEGAAFVYHGGPGGLAATPAVTLERDQAEAALGNSVAGAGDVNGDGYADVIAGAPYYDNGQEDEGAAFVYHGGPGGLAATPAWTVAGDQANVELGGSVAGAGDVNGDGYADVIIGAPGYANGQAYEGAAFVYHGRATGLAATPAWTLEGDQAYAELGHSVAGAGDVNGDGYADVVVGVSRYDNGQTSEGAAFVYHGGAGGLAATPAWTVESNQEGAELGWDVAGVGDVNGDGYADVIVGAPFYYKGQINEGAAFVYHGGAGGLAATPAWTVEGDQEWAELGYSVAGAGDVNGDGYADVIVGADQYGNGQDIEGAAFAYYGNRAGRPLLAGQQRGSGGSRVQPWGLSYAGQAFRVSLNATSPRGRERVKLAVEACGPGLAFGAAGCAVYTSPGWVDVTVTGGGIGLSVPVDNLARGTLYRWRARVLYAPYTVTQAGISAPPRPAHGPWRRLNGQAVEADIRALTPVDSIYLPFILKRQ